MYHCGLIQQFLEERRIFSVERARFQKQDDERIAIDDYKDRQYQREIDLKRHDAMITDFNVVMAALEKKEARIQWRQARFGICIAREEILKAEWSATPAEFDAPLVKLQAVEERGTSAGDSVVLMADDDGCSEAIAQVSRKKEELILNSDADSDSTEFLSCASFTSETPLDYPTPVQDNIDPSTPRNEALKYLGLPAEFNGQVRDAVASGPSIEYDDIIDYENQSESIEKVDNNLAVELNHGVAVEQVADGALADDTTAGEGDEYLTKDTMNPAFPFDQNLSAKSIEIIDIGSSNYFKTILNTLMMGDIQPSLEPCTYMLAQQAKFLKRTNLNCLRGFDGRGIMRHLKIIKSIFLLGDGVFLSLLLEGQDSKDVEKLLVHFNCDLLGIDMISKDPVVIVPTYQIPHPFSAIITERQMQEYLEIFQFLFGLVLHHRNSLVDESGQLLKMHKRQFMALLLDHIFLQGVQEPWNQMEVEIVQSGSCEEIIHAHNTCLATIRARVFLIRQEALEEILDCHDETLVHKISEFRDILEP